MPTTMELSPEQSGRARDENEATLVGGCDPLICPDATLVSAAPTLVILSDDGFGRVISVDRAHVIIGRSPRADVVVSDPEISRRHVMLKGSADGLICQDLGSTNGTFVNGERISRTILREGDVVRAGATIIKCTHAG